MYKKLIFIALLVGVPAFGAAKENETDACLRFGVLLPTDEPAIEGSNVVEFLNEHANTHAANTGESPISSASSSPSSLSLGCSAAGSSLAPGAQFLPALYIGASAHAGSSAMSSSSAAASSSSSSSSISSPASAQSISVVPSPTGPQQNSQVVVVVPLPSQHAGASVASLTTQTEK